MRFSKINTVSDNDGCIVLISVETDVSRGLYHFGIVGLPDKAVGESRDRISAAIKNSGFDSPKTKNHKITSSLIPAHIKKSGSSFDLPIALSYLHAIGTIRSIPNGLFILGELSLDGKIRSIKNALGTLFEAYKLGVRKILMPEENKAEIECLAAEFPDLLVYFAGTFNDAVDHLTGEKEISSMRISKIDRRSNKGDPDTPSFEDIVDQNFAKRAALIAVAGGHHLLLAGQPGTGKTLLAKACGGILPHLTLRQAIEQRSLFGRQESARGQTLQYISTEAPFRSPHHTSSYSSIIGSAARSLPGEITRAHKGILLLMVVLQCTII